MVRVDELLYKYWLSRVAPDSSLLQQNKLVESGATVRYGRYQYLVPYSLLVVWKVFPYNSYKIIFCRYKPIDLIRK